MDKVSMRGIVKRFGGFCANEGVNFTLEQGEIHALLGENGAGKTTLMNILYGVYAADEGEIVLDGKPVEIRSPRDAMAHGIGMVHQHFMLVPNFTVAENIILGMEDKPWLDIRQVSQEIEALSRQYGLKVDPRAKVSSLSIGEQERVEIMRVLYRKAEILILDEPTAVLTPQETEDLFVVLKNLTAQGVSIVIITHKLDEIMSVTDRVTVLRAGRQVNTVKTAETSKSRLAEMMVGREVVLKVERPQTEIGDVVLEMKNVTYAKGGVKLLDGVSLSIRAGEIVGIAGVDGNGQRELANAVAGLLAVQKGEISFENQRIDHASVESIIKKGVSYVPEDRLKDGLVGDFSIEDNFILKALKSHTSFGVFRKKRIHAAAQRLIEEYDIRCSAPSQQAKLLSGGNQQKIILARELERAPKFLCASQPTRGLDVGAIEFIWNTIMKAKSNGMGVLLISTELEEIFALCDRILVIYEGRLIGGAMTPQTADINRLGLLMAGVETNEERRHDSI